MSEKKDLTSKQYIFCMEYIIDYNATRAATKAGYSIKTADSQGSRMLKNVKVKAFLDNKTKERADKLEVTKDLIVQELAKIAFHDIRDLYDENGNLLPIPQLDDNTAATISSFKSKREYQGKDEEGNAEYAMIDEYKRFDKIKTLELLGKHLGMFSDTKPDGDTPKAVSLKVSFK